MMQTESRKQLTSWKEIAEHLGVSVRTAQRYEQEMGLPVRRLGGEKGRGVVAEVEGLNTWKNKVELAPPATTPFWKGLRFLQIYSACLTVICSLLVVVLVWQWAKTPSGSGQPYSSQWIESTLLVLDRNGQELWRHVFPFLHRSDVPLRPSHADLDGDGKTETLVPMVSWEKEPTPSKLYCLSESGKELWKVQPSRPVGNRAMRFSTFYILRDYRSFASPEKKGAQWTAAVFVNRESYPSVVVVVDEQGKQRGEYWHAGHFESIHVADIDRDGKVELVLAGTSASERRAIIEIFDPGEVSGAEALPVDDAHRFMGFPARSPKARIVFGRSRLNRLREPFNFAYWVGNTTGIDDGGFLVHVSETLSREQGYLIYTIGKDLQLVSIVPSQSLYRTYQEYSITTPSSPPLGDADLEALRRGYRADVAKSSSTGAR